MTPLFYLAGKELSLFWLSSGGDLHSLNLHRTPRAAVTVHSSAENWKQIRGVQMRGSVSRFFSRSSAPPGSRYCERFKLGRGFRLVLRQSALYEFTPEFFRYLDNAQGFGFRLNSRANRKPGHSRGPGLRIRWKAISRAAQRWLERPSSRCRGLFIHFLHSSSFPCGAASMTVSAVFCRNMSRMHHGIVKKQERHHSKLAFRPVSFKQESYGISCIGYRLSLTSVP